MAADPRFERGAALERLASTRFDVFVVGGGIVGAGVAALAAAQGLAVALVDGSDFASATSSASSKLIHGGLRYLRMGDVGLVREALHEERALSGTVAPHLVRRLSFALPIYEDGPYGRVAIRSALLVYRSLAGANGSSRVLRPADVAALVPSLRLDGLRAAGLYGDAQTNDSRLCLATLRAAAEGGATVLNYAEAVSIQGDGVRGFAVEVADRVGGGGVRVEARALVNAAGPWVDAVRRLEAARAGTSVALSKGVHLVLPLPEGWQAAVTVPVDRTRVSFAIPWEGVLLLGTTDDPFDGDPGTVAATDDDQRQILAEAGRALDADAVRPESVLARFAGLRVLPASARGTASARREITVTRGPRGMVSVAGGKLTTYRRIAVAALAPLRSELGLRSLRPLATPLPGADREREIRAHAIGAAGAHEPLVPGEPELVAHVLYARDREWAVTAEDVLRRRTTLALRGHDTPQLRERVAALLD